jgi:hypothetical protein
LGVGGVLKEDKEQNQDKHRDPKQRTRRKN